MADIKLKSNVAEIEKAMEQAKKRALEKVGMFVETEAKKLAPVDTGRLRNSITHEQEDENTEIIGSNVEYASFVCLGTSKMGARPYLRPAIDNNRDKINKIIKSELGNS